MIVVEVLVRRVAGYVQMYVCVACLCQLACMYVHVGRSWLGACLGAVANLLYKCGSLLYLAATAILCLDVVILHW